MTNSHSAALGALIAYIDDLETRLSAARAGYLDNINNANLATVPAISAARIGYLDNINNAELLKLPFLTTWEACFVHEKPRIAAETKTGSGAITYDKEGCLVACGNSVDDTAILTVNKVIKMGDISQWHRAFIFSCNEDSNDVANYCELGGGTGVVGGNTGAFLDLKNEQYHAENTTAAFGASITKDRLQYCHITAEYAIPRTTFQMIGNLTETVVVEDCEFAAPIREALVTTKSHGAPPAAAEIYLLWAKDWFVL